MTRIFEDRFRFMAESPSGPVGRHLARLGARVESAAKAIATAEGLVRTGRYRQSIAWRINNTGGGLVLQVGSAVPHARVLERGSQPHIIRPRNAKALWWDMPNDRGWMVQPDSGRPVRFVMHPGNRPYHVLGRALQAALKGAA